MKCKKRGCVVASESASACVGSKIGGQSIGNAPEKPKLNLEEQEALLTQRHKPEKKVRK